MRDERKLNKIIQEQDSENRELILQRLHQAHPELDAEPQKKKSAFSWQRLVLAACACCLLICAVVIPSVYFTKGGKVTEPIERYCSLSEYEAKEFDSNIKQYCQTANKNILYFDWYDKAYYRTTRYYIELATNETLGVYETISIEEPEYTISIKAVEKSIILEGVTDEITLCTNVSTVSNLAVKWTKKSDTIISTFEYGDYRYIVTLFYEQDENKLFDLIAELLEK